MLFKEVTYRSFVQEEWLDISTRLRPPQSIKMRLYVRSMETAGSVGV